MSSSAERRQSLRSLSSGAERVGRHMRAAISSPRKDPTLDKARDPKLTFYTPRSTSCPGLSSVLGDRPSVLVECSDSPVDGIALDEQPVGVVRRDGKDGHLCIPERRREGGHDACESCEGNPTNSKARSACELILLSGRLDSPISCASALADGRRDWESERYSTY